MACRSPRSRKGRSLRAPVRLTVESLAFGGDAVARDADGRVVFVPLAAPGDQIEAQLTEEKKGFARAELIRVLAPGPAREAPRCALFGQCGGCQWQHVSYPAQLLAKTDVVARALRAQLAEGAVLEPIIAAPVAFGYRRRARLAVRPGVRGGAVGFRARRSHELVDVPECPLFEPALNVALAALRAGLLPSIDRPCSLELLAGREGVHVALALPVSSALRAAALMLITSGVACGVAFADEVVGAPDVDLAEPGQPPLRAPAGAFAQAQREQNRVLRELVVAYAASAGARVLELHAGSGNLSEALLAAGARELCAVEESAEAVARGRLQVTGEHVTWRVGLADAALREASGRFDVLVLDPPRTGDAEAARVLATLPDPPRRVVWVSCDPMTLSRDLALVRDRYRLVRARALDMTPQTYHVEVVTELSLR